ncbi:MAG TPA: FliM/FliN family flagellar motor switch protein [Terracidiphilus sp.]|nr:FliM/FliN family flagellar motor switch protein [Terracidiphilus sp.]
MKTYRDCWISSAKALFSQALAGEPQLTEVEGPGTQLSGGIAFEASLSGDSMGQFTVVVDPRIVDAPLLGDGVDQEEAWKELVREVAEAAAGELLADCGVKCRVDSIRRIEVSEIVSCNFHLTGGEHSWGVAVRDEVRSARGDDSSEGRPEAPVADSEVSHHGGLSAGVELLLDVEIEAALRFGCCEMSLGEILELGPGAIIELDRHVSDPVDLIVGDKIVARGDVVLMNGNFGLRVTEIAMPQKRLESIRCLF